MSTVSLVLNRVIQALGWTVQDGLCICHHPSPNAHTCTTAYDLFSIPEAIAAGSGSLGLCFTYAAKRAGATGSQLAWYHHLLNVRDVRQPSKYETGRVCVWHRTSETVCRCSLAATQGSFSSSRISMRHVTTRIRPLFALVIWKHWWYIFIYREEQHFSLSDFLFHCGSFSPLRYRTVTASNFPFWKSCQHFKFVLGKLRPAWPET